MPYEIDLTHYNKEPVYTLGEDFSGTSKAGETIDFNNFYMNRNGKPYLGVSGEFHYSRMDDSRWEDELIKMRMGGVNIVATYLFWNHIEEDEGQFDFTGRRDLRKFITLCAKLGLYVILRVGPFDHGEVRNGGLPDWLYSKPYEVRHTNEGFMNCVRRLYEKISEQVQGLFFKDNGPIIGVQLDNEYMHSSAAWEFTTGISDEWIYGGSEGEAYILKLREIALDVGLAPVFFTGTAWGGAAYSDKVMPLWGGYAYRPWIFYSHKGEHPATEEYVYEDYHHDNREYTDDFTPAYEPQSRPYACCEMGAGMMCCYYYRFIYPYKSVDALANIKLGSGCNFIGYYMFQGGTNPIGRHGTYMNEAQVPKLSYDYQAALGEFGQVRESYKRLKAIHLFTQFFGEKLAPMETVLPLGASKIDAHDTKTLRFAVRTDGNSGFVFVNNFQDHVQMDPVSGEIVIKMPKKEICFDISLAPEENCILPFNMELDGIRLLMATAQPVLRTVVNGQVTYVFMQPDGMKAKFDFEEGARIAGDCTLGDFDVKLFTVSKDALSVDVDILLINREMANKLYLLKNGALVFTDEALLEDDDNGLRLETTKPSNSVLTYPQCLFGDYGAGEGVLSRYEFNTDEKKIPIKITEGTGARFILELPSDMWDGIKDARLRIDYEGDIGHLFLDDVMISDNFANGDTWEVGLMEHKEKLCTKPLVLTITPIKEGANVNVESAMAARNESVKSSVARLINVRVQPVYEIAIGGSYEQD